MTASTLDRAGHTATDVLGATATFSFGTFALRPPLVKDGEAPIDFCLGFCRERFSASSKACRRKPSSEARFRFSFVVFRTFTPELREFVLQSSFDDAAAFATGSELFGDGDLRNAFERTETLTGGLPDASEAAAFGIAKIGCVSAGREDLASGEDLPDALIKLVSERTLPSCVPLAFLRSSAEALSFLEFAFERIAVTIGADWADDLAGADWADDPAGADSGLFLAASFATEPG